jgi:hypothetical protein
MPCLSCFFFFLLFSSIFSCSVNQQRGLFQEVPMQRSRLNDGVPLNLDGQILVEETKMMAS